MGNHQSLFFWLTNVIQISQGKDKSYFSVKDKSNNEITFYDDKGQALFKAFCKALPKVEFVKVV